MKEIEKLFDSDSVRKKAEDLLSMTTQEEIYQWSKHPCTQAVLYTLHGDYMDHHTAWENGVFTDSNADGTAQKNAKAMGSMEAIKLIAQYIEEINSNDNSERV